MHKELSGKEFYELFPNLSKKLVKLTNNSECHNGFQFKTGLNKDTASFNPIDECQAGGIYFTDIDNLPRWLEYGDSVMKYYRTLTLPPDSRVYIEENKFKADQIILDERVQIGNLHRWLDNVYCLKAIGFNNYRSWRYIKNEYAQIDAIDRGISIAHMLANRASISEKVLRHSMTGNSFFPSVNWCAEYSDAIIFASKYGHLEVLKFLLSDEIWEKYPNIDPSADHNHAIRWACYSGHLDVVQFLLSDQIIAKYHNINPSTDNNYPIRIACQNCHLDLVKFLLSDLITAKFPNIDPCADFNNAIRWACHWGHIEVVKFLLSDQIIAKYPNINPSTGNNYPIRIACQNGKIDIVKFLLSDQITAKFPNIDPSANNNDAIILADRNGHIDVVKFLLQDHRVIKIGIPHYINLL